ncbi:hypothetical protein [Bacillus salacetis]|uniref:hypothetical protein n=1 Tax=Bacillus salacetis TaxID=2315464 RepID=UPI0014444D72|nr:hypothetical protein [Bacillus salacetis]
MPEKRWKWGIISWQTENDVGKAVEMGHHSERDQRMMPEKRWNWSIIQRESKE